MGVIAYRGDSDAYGTPTDPMNGLKIGGVNVFGGGLAFYAAEGKTVVGALGVSGDTSCADHNIAWEMRAALGFTKVPGGVSATGDDNIVYDITHGVSAGGFSHAKCGAGVVASPTNVTKAQ